MMTKRLKKTSKTMILSKPLLQLEAKGINSL